MQDPSELVDELTMFIHHVGHLALKFISATVILKRALKDQLIAKHGHKDLALGITPEPKQMLHITIVMVTTVFSISTTISIKLAEIEHPSSLTFYIYYIIFFESFQVTMRITGHSPNRFAYSRTYACHQKSVRR